jgi:hypothetical protein
MRAIISGGTLGELHQWVLAHRRSITLDGLNVSVAPVEYVILRELEYFREGKSEKHVRDIRGMLEVRRTRLIAKRDVVLTYALRALVDDGVMNPVAATAMPRQRLLRGRPDRASAEASRGPCTR